MWRSVRTAPTVEAPCDRGVPLGRRRTVSGADTASIAVVMFICCAILGAVAYVAINDRRNVNILNWFRRRPPSNLVAHARRELKLIGEDPDTIDGYVKVIQAFADMGHSGGSASVAIPTINRLLNFENLAPLTDNPDDWIEVGDGLWQNGLWQNRRCSRMFSEDGGKTYTDVNDGGPASKRPVHTSAADAER